MKSTRSLDKLLEDADSDLAMLVTRTRLLKRLTNIIRNQLDPELAKHCYVGNIDGETLVVLADTPARASKLRFYSAELIQQLPAMDKTFAALKFIRVKVLNDQVAESPATEPALKTGPHLNQDNARGLKTLADSVDDQPLHDALLRLTRHAK